MNPTLYSEAMSAAICSRIADGESVRSICRDADMPNKSTVMDWLAHPDREDFRFAYAAACELRGEALAEEALDIADDATKDTKLVGEDAREACDTEWVARSKLRIDTRKWLAGKLAPKKYGDAATLKLTDPDGNNPFAGLMELVAANGRPRPASDS